MTPYCHIHKKAIGPNRNYYRIYFDFIPFLIQISYICIMKLRKECNLLEMSVG